MKILVTNEKQSINIEFDEKNPDAVDASIEMVTTFINGSFREACKIVQKFNEENPIL